LPGHDVRTRPKRNLARRRSSITKKKPKGLSRVLKKRELSTGGKKLLGKEERLSKKAPTDQEVKVDPKGVVSL